MVWLFLPFLPIFADFADFDGFGCFGSKMGVFEGFPFKSRFCL
jgi:hypothetical protein